MKLIIINALPTSMIFGKKVDAWWFEKNGFEVEFLDISNIFFSNEEIISYYGGNTDYRYKAPNQTSVNSMTDLLKKLDDINKNNSVIYYLSRSIYRTTKDEKVLKYIQSKNIILFFKAFDTEPIPNNFYLNLVYKLRMLKRKINNINIKPDVYFGCGEVSRTLVTFIFPKTKFIPISSPKIEWQKKENVIQKDYIVFVDESIEYEPDAKMQNKVSCINLNAYYRRMNKLFDNLEEWLGILVIIGASGKYIYPENRFGDREIIYKKTFSLIEHATLVVGHTSSALDHNIKCKKPMLFIDDKSFTQYKRDGFKTAIPLIGNKIYMSDEVTKEDIENILKKENKDFHRLVNDYFKEDGVNEDYREIMAKAFRECIANKIQT